MRRLILRLIAAGGTILALDESPDSCFHVQEHNQLLSDIRNRDEQHAAQYDHG